MDADAQAQYLGERRSWKPQPSSPPFSLAPGDLAVFAQVYEIIRKLNSTLIIGRFFGAQEELGNACLLTAFMGDAANIARTAIEDAPASTNRVYRLVCAFCLVVGDLCMFGSVRGARRRLACGGASPLVSFGILLESV
jgi:hypothetical protein